MIGISILLVIVAELIDLGKLGYFFRLGASLVVGVAFFGLVFQAIALIFLD